MTETLYLEIFQPYAQYRNPFTFYYAQTFPLPPKSTIIGMLQNATDRYYDLSFWDLKISVHGGFESFFWNYQQLIKGYPEIEEKGNKLMLVVEEKQKKKKRSLKLLLYNDGIKAQRAPVYQQEMFNGHLHIFIRGKREIIEEIYYKLENSKKILSLGRSEDIIFIRNILLFENNNKYYETEKSLWLTFPTYIKSEIKLSNGMKKTFPIKNQKYPVYMIPTYVAFYNDGIPIKNKTEINKNKTKRKVEFEKVIYTGFDYVVKLLEPIQYEEININNKKFRIIKEFGWL